RGARGAGAEKEALHLRAARLAEAAARRGHPGRGAALEGPQDHHPAAARRAPQERAGRAPVRAPRVHDEGKELRLFVLALALAAAAQGAAAQEQVTLQLKWKHQFQFAGYYAALEKGFYRDAGFSVVLVEANENTDPVDEVLSGRAQFGVGASELA